MNIKVTRKTSPSQLQQQVEQEVYRFMQILKIELDAIGLEAVTKMRQKSPSDGGFNDQTGNLRSSIGYIIIHNGQQLAKSFEIKLQGSEGLTAGEKYANDIAKQYKKGWAIIFVAGMEYASWVEARGRDVTTGSTLGLESKVREAWNRAKAA